MKNTNPPNQQQLDTAIRLVEEWMTSYIRIADAADIEITDVKTTPRFGSFDVYIPHVSTEKDYQALEKAFPDIFHPIFRSNGTALTGMSDSAYNDLNDLASETGMGINFHVHPMISVHGDDFDEINNPNAPLVLHADFGVISLDSDG